MRRRSIHVLFALVALALLVFFGVQYRAMDQIDETNARFIAARDVALSGELDEAEPALVAMIAQHGTSSVGLAARFELGNAYLREASRADVDPRRRRPLAELAKERYRELLRVSPDDWDARGNLELALRLAPERVADDVDADIDPVKRVDVVVPDFEPRDRP